MLGNIVAMCPLAPETSTNVPTWDGYGVGVYEVISFDFEVGCCDGVHWGWVHVTVPFFGRKDGIHHLYNNVFAHMWHWGFVWR